MGFYKPTTTQAPDPIFDYWLTRLTGAELRVLLYAVRRTYGFKKDDDNISLDQFEHGIRAGDGTVLDEGCGCSRKSILRAIKLLVDKGLLIKTRRRDADKRDDVNNYRLHIIDARQEQPERGFRKVNTTQVPDEVFDHWLPRLSDAELFVLLYIIRRTLGFQKPTDVISTEQFLIGVRTRAGAVLDDGCGVSKKHLYLALGGLKDKELVAVQRRRSQRAGNIPSVYSVIFENDVPGILSRSSDDRDPRAEAYDVGVDSTLVSSEPTSPPVDDDVAGTTVQRTLGAQQGRRIETPRGEHKDDQRGANRHLQGRIAAPRGEHKDDQRGACRLQKERSATHTQEHTDNQGYGSQSASQQTAYYQQTGKQETDSTQTDNWNNGISKTSKHWSDMNNSERTMGPVTFPRYSVLISQRITNLSLLFHDRDHQRSNRTRALRLWVGSGLGEQTFADMMQEARLIAMERGNIEKDATGEPGVYDGTKNRMPYFFAVLEDLIDMARDTGSATQSAQPEGGHGHADRPRQEPAMEMPTTPGVALPQRDVLRKPIRDSRLPGGARPVQESPAYRQDGDGVESADRDLWTGMLDEVRLVVTKENYATWLGSTYVVDRVGNVLLVAVPTKFHQEWLTHKLRGLIMAALDRRGHGGLQIDYVVVPTSGADNGD